MEEDIMDTDSLKIIEKHDSIDISLKYIRDKRWNIVERAIKLLLINNPQANKLSLSIK